MARLGASRKVVAGTVVMEGFFCLGMAIFLAGAALGLTLWMFDLMEHT